jgi:hypothetical protein
VFYLPSWTLQNGKESQNTAQSYQEGKQWKQEEMRENKGVLRKNRGEKIGCPGWQHGLPPAGNSYLIQ